MSAVWRVWRRTSDLLGLTHAPVPRWRPKAPAAGHAGWDAVRGYI
jgi:hypothetical protein